MATAPIFAATPKQGMALTATASAASYTAPTNTVAVVTASTTLRVERLRLTFGTTTSLAGFACVYLKRSSVFYLVRTVAYTAITASVTVAPALADGSGLIVFEGGLLMENGDTLEIAFTNGTGTLIGTADYATFA